MLQDILSSAALLLSVVVFIPTVFFTIECLAGSIRGRGAPRRQNGRRPQVAVLVPAHNEELQIVDTLRSIQSQMREGDRLIVVADNCNDLTASLAREAGADVIVRYDPVRRGKGYALDAGVRYLSLLPPDVVIVVDADCWLEPGALDNLAHMAAATNRPVQSRYLMVAPPDASINLAVSEFAFLLKNRIRLLGLAKLGLPAQLTGSGMAFPWAILRDASLANGNLVEDMKLGLDLAKAGYAPLFCDAAAVSSRFPYSKKGLETQSSRWDAGRFALTAFLLSTLLDINTFRNRAYLALVVDALIPPLTLLAALLLLALCPAVLLATAGIAISPLVVSAISILAFDTALSMAWWRHGRRTLPLHTLADVPAYIFRKLRLYPRHILEIGGAAWIRTDRNRVH
ncbi:hypothetical protein PMI07_000292 [Rhizobium sp. CF080]|uniref:glycosyltransferase family 2 protein n=1 Tax=Rhizobium sp. (strain CF080) TaxID=1144310 RepID=UPI0002716684|nr:glycosyltransferase family 2 protein [Rhizobium sp. CF080]EUB97732.1 hypothetical protein PMI07_000292 [Rhizobium sp. CF080]